MKLPGECAWCGAPATARVHVRGRGLRKVYALACREHAARYVPPAPAKPQKPVEQREPPLCGSCMAEVTWVTLIKDGVEGKRMPVDRRPVTGKEPKRSLVVVNPSSGRGVVLTDALVASGDAQHWIDNGARLHFSHFFTCSSAQLHRRQNRTTNAAAQAA